MSTESYRNTVKRLTKKKADVDGDIAKERSKAEKLRNDILSQSNSITPQTPASIRRMKERQLKTKGAALTKSEQASAGLEKSRSDVVADLNRALSNLEKAEAKAQGVRDAEDKRRRDTEFKHAKSVTRELKTQAQLHKTLGQSRYTIDLRELPDEINVLFVAANPVTTKPLELDEERRAIKERIRASEYREAIRIEPVVAARAGDLIQALNEHKPRIVHFSGHGSEDGNLVFKRDDGSANFVSPEAIAQTFATAGNVDLCLGIFDACFSEAQAQAVTEHIDFAIGMNYRIGDAAARQFAAYFYGALGFGHSIARAFGQARAAAMMEDVKESQNPQLFARSGLDPDAVILVRPPTI